MLFWLYPTITQNYFMLCLIVCSGTLQWAAARNNRPALSLLGAWGIGWPGMIGGGAMVSGGFVWFFAVTPGLFEEGLAGGELSTLFGLACLTALAIARLAGIFWNKVGNTRRRLQDELHDSN